MRVLIPLLVLVIIISGYSVNKQLMTLSKGDNKTGIGGRIEVIFDEADITENLIIRDSLNFDDIDYEYCCLWDGATGYDETCFIADSLFVDEEHDDYHLSWNSPCIDAGDPDNDGDFENWLFDEDDQDSDGSRLSIGYAAYEDQDRWEYEDGDIVWMSFPKLSCVDGVNNGDQILGSIVFGRFDEMLPYQPDYIDVWQETDIGPQTSFEGDYISQEYVWYPQNYNFNSTDGLKIRITDSDSTDNPINPLIVGGLSCELNTSLTVTTGATDLNWVGYFVPYKMN
ncbi:MAG: hypothetical protein P9M05_10175, partial [Candidatus Stygibacter australis]|nr:hypothetical protein [Candidatus Stygibacter australis]